MLGGGLYDPVPIGLPHPVSPIILVPPLPVTPAVGPFTFGQEFIVVFSWVGLGLSARKRFPFVNILQAGTAKLLEISQQARRNQSVICAIINSGFGSFPIQNCLA
jgi:hypothetical protein